MEIRDPGEAAYIACEMEKRAIRLYERALALFADSPCQEAIRAILGDERNHLRQFQCAVRDQMLHTEIRSYIRTGTWP